MNERIKDLVGKAKFMAEETINRKISSNLELTTFAEKFTELIKQAIYDDVKEELIDDAIINAEPDSLSREYLKGCNGGTVDALYHIKQFGLEEIED